MVFLSEKPHYSTSSDFDLSFLDNFLLSLSKVLYVFVLVGNTPSSYIRVEETFSRWPNIQKGREPSKKPAIHTRSAFFLLLAFNTAGVRPMICVLTSS